MPAISYFKAAMLSPKENCNQPSRAPPDNWQDSHDNETGTIKPSAVRRDDASVNAGRLLQLVGSCRLAIVS